MLLFSCNKEEESLKPLSEEISFENINQIPINDFIDEPFNNVAGVTYSNVFVSKEGIITDLNKVIIEMKISHSDARDLDFTLIAPDGTESIFIDRAGTTQYSGSNRLRFSSAFNVKLPNLGNIPAGNYKESQGLNLYQPVTLLPIFSNLEGKNIMGIWKLRVRDNNYDKVGSILTWKILFETGALNQ